MELKDVFLDIVPNNIQVTYSVKTLDGKVSRKKTLGKIEVTKFGTYQLESTEGLKCGGSVEGLVIIKPYVKPTLKI